MDQLLEEYLRVINDKDDEIHRRIKAEETLRAEHRLRQSTHKKQLATLHKEMAEKDKTIAQLTADAEESEHRLQAMTRTLAARETELQAAHTAAQEQQCSSAATTQRLETTLAAREEELRALSAAHDAVQAEQTRVRDENVSLARQLRDAEAALLTTRAELTRGAQECAELRRTVADSVPRAEMLQATQTLQQQLATHTRQAKKTQAALQQRLQTASEQAARLQEELLAAQHAQHTTSVELESRGKELDACAQRLRESELRHEHALQAVQHELTTLQQQRGADAEHTAQLERQLGDRDDALRQLRESMRESELVAERVRATSEKDVELLQAALRTTKEQTQALQQQLESAQRDAARTTTALHESQQTLAQLRTESATSLGELRTQLATATATTTAQKDELDRLQYELKYAQQRLQDEHTATRVQQVESQQRLAELQRVQQQLQDAQAAARNAEQQRRHNHTTTQQAHETALRELQRRHEAELADLHAQLERRKKEQDGDLRGVQHWSEQCSQLQTELAAARHTLALRDELVTQSQRRVTELQAELTAQARRRDAHDADLVRAHEALRQAEAVTADLRTALAAQERHTTEARQARDELQRELHASTTAAAQAQAQLHAVTAELQTSQAAVTAAQAQIAHTRDELAEVQRELRRRDDAADAARHTAEEQLRHAHAELAAHTAVAQHAAAVEQHARAAAAEALEAERRHAVVLHEAQHARQLALSALAEERAQLRTTQERLTRHESITRVQLMTLQERVTQLQAEIAARDADAAAAATAAGRQEERLCAAHTHVAQLEHDLRQSETIVAQLRDALAQSETRVAAMRADVDDAATLRGRYRREKAKMCATVTACEAQRRRAEAAVTDARHQRSQCTEVHAQELQRLREQLRAGHAVVHHVMDQQRAHWVETGLATKRALYALLLQQHVDMVALVGRTLHEVQRQMREEREQHAAQLRRVTARLDDRAAEQRHAEAQLRAELSAAHQTIAARERDVRRAQDAHRDKPESSAQIAERDAALHAAEQRLSHAQSSLSSLTCERRRLERRVQELGHQLEAVTAELQTATRTQAELITELAQYKAEASTLRERCSNLESLKHIQDTTLHETQSRERELREKVEELRGALHLRGDDVTRGRRGAPTANLSGSGRGTSNGFVTRA